MVRLCGSALGLLAFGTTILLGLAAGNPSQVILVRALWAMVIFCGVGVSVGWVAYRVLDDHALRTSREMFPEEDGDEEKQAPDPSASDAEQQGMAPSASGDEGVIEPGQVAAGR